MDSLLGKDLKRYAERTNRKPVVAMEMKFPGDYPMNPPFVRILRPRFKYLTGTFWFQYVTLSTCRGDFGNGHH